MPPTLTYPGVYIEELSNSVHTITGVATSIAAFVGWAARGPTTQATLVQSFTDFQNRFGGLDSRSLLGYSVNHFFGNGGQQAYIVRVAQSSAITTAGSALAGTVSIATAGGALTLTAKTPGAWSTSCGILITAGTTAGTFKLMVVYAPSGAPLVVMEAFDNLSVSPAITITSRYVTLALTGAPAANPPNGLYLLTGGFDGSGADSSSTAVPVASPATVTVFEPGSSTIGFTFTANSPGSWGNLLAIQATPLASDPTGTRFSVNVLTVAANGSLAVIESFNNLSVNASDASSYILTVINADSSYVTVAQAGGSAPTKALSQAAPTSVLPLPAQIPLTGAFLTGGVDGIVLDPTQDTSSGGLFKSALNADGSGTGGVRLLDRVNIFNLLCVPGESESSTIQSLQQYCHDKRAFYIVDAPQNVKISDLIANGPTGNDNVPGLITGQYSINSAYYFPWVQAPDPQAGNRTRAFPPCGFVAGIYADTDVQRGVWKAPAGIDASLSGVTGLQAVLTDAENGSLNVQAVNCLRQFKIYGDVVWGARTLRGNDPAGSQWKYLPIRRLALFLESSLYDGTQWVVFEPNDESLWGQIRLNVGAFMQGLFAQGAFQGTTPQQAYFVKCDAENNPQASINLGIVNILVGFAPLYPAEFVVIQIQQMAGQVLA